MAPFLAVKDLYLASGNLAGRGFSNVR